MHGCIEHEADFQGLGLYLLAVGSGFTGSPSLEGFLNPGKAGCGGETKLKLNGDHLFVWAAVDMDSRELLAVDASWQRSSLNAWFLLRKVLKACLNKPLILVDKGPCYGFKGLGLPWRHVTYGLRNCVGCWFRTLKERARRFCNNVNSKRQSLTPIRLFLSPFAYHYNHPRTHQTLGKPPVK